ncbi:hypothetical protein GMD78_08860 [Ornithinibacillus sp. L9]|uniref:Uncharacterized protein n=1 Tax=Ornithinibacillus caprae TaxID=2678566 RepID=A0A6N8FH06_9BACI|nr:hypothetical protein [Ornithinibacillus caprae]MUK88501.1 hypothetical protein [Ornithinibacillus caprae]
MNNNRKAMILILIGLLFISLILNYKFYRTNQERNNYYTIYINDFFYEIKNSIEQLDLIIEGNNEIDLHREFSSLTEKLSNMDYMISRVPYYIDGMGGLSNFIGDALAVINRGTNYKGKYIPSFIDDQELNQQEIAYLRLMKEYFVSIYEQLVLEETGQLSESITKQQFIDIINENIFVLGKQDELLEEYIKYSKN